MSVIDAILLHLDHIYDTLDPILIPGLLYLPVRGWKHLKKVRFGVVAILIIYLAYVALFGAAATGWVQERYYRPIIPFGAMLAALGYYCFAQDVKNRKVLYGLAALVALACMVDMLRKPLREHRRPQVEAGKWLKQYDPKYDGCVVSNYSIPVLYADMRYFDPKRTEDLFLDLVDQGRECKYIILDEDEKDTWYGQYALKNNWVLIYREPERDIRIFKNPDYTSGSTNQSRAQRG